jgi:hypothetical protein
MDQESEVTDRQARVHNPGGRPSREQSKVADQYDQKTDTEKMLCLYKAEYAFRKGRVIGKRGV